MSTHTRSLRALAAAVLALAPMAASAGSIVTATTIENVPGGNYSNFYVENLINQSGLSANYIGGVTDFDSFVATTTHANPSISYNGGFASPSNDVTDYDFHLDFGSAMTLSRFALWNDTDYQSIGDFTVYAADSSFGSLTSLGSFTGLISYDGSAQVFDFTDATSQYFVISATTVADYSNLMNVGEFAFEMVGTPEVPVPASLPLLAAGIGAFGMMRRKRNKA